MTVADASRDGARPRPDARRAPGGPRLSSLLWLAARGGASDRLRIALTAFAAALATLLALALAVVLALPEDPNRMPYRVEVFNDRGLLPGVVLTGLLMMVTVVLFGGQCARIGGPERDRRLAGLRLAGATPREVRRIVALEAGLAACLGALLGLALGAVVHVVDGWAGRGVVHVERQFDPATGQVVTGQFPIQVQRAVPTEVVPPWWLILLALVLVPGATLLATRFATRRLEPSPLAVVRRHRTRPPALLPLVLFAVGAGGLGLWGRVLDDLPRERAAVVFGGALVLLVLVVVGLVWGTAAMAHHVGAWLGKRTGSPALLVAARRMETAPFTASRATSAVLLTVLLGAGVLATRAHILTWAPHNGRDEDPFLSQTFDVLSAVTAFGVVMGAAGLLVVTAEAIVTRRRSLAALAAAGCPRATLAKAIVIETLLPLVPTALIAAGTGVLVVRAMFGTAVTGVDHPGGFDGQGNPVGPGVPHSDAVPVPWDGLGYLVGGAFVAVLLVALLSLVFLRRSTDVAELRAAA